MTQNTTRSLRYDFTEPENQANAKSLARENQALDESEQARKQINADLKANESRIAASITKLSRWVNDGYDYRPIECKIVFNNPEDGKKSIFRLDTKELVETLPMEDHEKQAFLDFKGEDEPNPEEFDGSRPAY